MSIRMGNICGEKMTDVIEYVYAVGVKEREKYNMIRLTEDFDYFIGKYPVGAAS